MTMKCSASSQAYQKKKACLPLSLKSYQDSKLRPLLFGAGLSFLCSLSIVGESSPSQARTLECYKEPFWLLTCVALDAYAAINFSWTADSTTAWGSWGLMGGRLSSGPSCVANTNGFECFGRGDNGNLWVREYGYRFGSTTLSRLRPWIDLGSPLAGDSTPSRIVGDPSCVGLVSSLNPAACFMNTEGGHYSMIGGNLNLGTPRSSRVFSAWRYLGRPELISSPSCVMRTRAEVMCVGISTGSRIAYRLFPFPGSITTPSGEWQYIDYSRSLGTPSIPPVDTGFIRRNKCNVGPSGQVVCVLPDVESDYRPAILEFSTGPASTLSMNIINSPSGFRPQECFYQGSLICVGNDGTAASTLNRSGPTPSWSRLEALAGQGNVVDCVQSTTATGQAVTECIATTAGFNSRRRRDGTLARASSSPNPMSVNRFYMGTWMPLAPLPGGAPLRLCHPINLPDVPALSRCLD